MTIKIDPSRDALLTDFGKATLSDRYLLPDETPQELFKRVAEAYQEDDAHGQRLYDYMSQLWFMPATPILSNGGTTRGLPISCFLNEVADSFEDIDDTQSENMWLASKGGGIGTYWGNVRSIGEAVGKVGKTSGIMPFIKVQDSQTLAVSQGSLRRGSAAAYIPIHHPEINEFIHMRKPTGGDYNRKCLNMHHGVVVDDKFMNAVKSGSDYDLISPHTGDVIETVSARKLWHQILELRLETGEPYILWIDTVNRALAPHALKQNLLCSTSNLCVEITLHTSPERTAVCCLSSLNLETYEQWKDKMDVLVYDVLLFLDNVLQSFIDTAPDSHAKAAYSAKMERSVGLGVMGFHGYLMSQGLTFAEPKSHTFNRQFFTKLQGYADLADHQIATLKGACPDWTNAKLDERPRRFTNKTSIAPTASISIICGGASAGTDLIPTNIYTHKTLSGSFTVKNKYLEAVLQRHGLNEPDVWSRILQDNGSVRNIKELTPQERDVFKTSFEIDQMQVVFFGGERAENIDQSQSLNVFINPDADKGYINNLHLTAWEMGIKSMYYCRSKSIRQAENIGGKLKREIILEQDECESCQ